jgi:hypothetical protein
MRESDAAVELEMRPLPWAIGRAVAVAALWFVALARPATGQGLGIGVGRTYAKLDVYMGATTRTRADPTAGVVYHVPLVSWIVFQPELWFTTKGSLQTGGYTGSTFRYLEAPITTRLWGAPAGRSGIRPVLISGVAPAFLLHCSWQPARSETLACSDTAHVEDFHTPQWDWAYLIGIGVELRAGAGWLVSIEARGEQGQRHLNRRNPNLRRRNQVSSVSVTFRPRKRAVR